MEHVLSHLPGLCIAALIIAGAAVLWTILLERQAKSKRRDCNSHNK